MTTLLYLLSIYAFLLTLATAYLGYRRKQDSIAAARIEAWFASAEPKPDSIRAYCQFRRTMQSEVSWIEKSVSTVGVIALAGMTGAAAIQTVRALKEQGDAERLRHEIKLMTDQRERYSSMAKEFVALAQQNMQRHGRLSDVEQRVLRFRFEELEQLSSRSTESTREQFDIAIALRDWRAASRTYESVPGLRDSVTIEDKLRLAEKQLIDGQPVHSKKLVDEIGSVRPTLKQYRVRALVLEAVHYPERIPDLVAEYASVTGLSKEDAQIRLEAEVANLTRAIPSKRLHKSGEGK